MASILIAEDEARISGFIDKGLRAHLTAAQWDSVVARMTERLASGATGAAVLAGLDAVGELLAGKALGSAADNRFADAPVVKGEGP